MMNRPSSIGKENVAGNTRVFAEVRHAFVRENARGIIAVSVCGVVNWVEVNV